jgi:hypothetical protein
MPYRDMGLDLFQTELGVPDLDAGFVEPLPGYSSALGFQPEILSLVMAIRALIRPCLHLATGLK